MSDTCQPSASLFGDIAPKFARLTDDVLFADLWQRPALSPRERSLVTVAALVAQTVDTLIFVTIAFWGLFPILPVIGGQLVAKAAIWGLTVPLLYAMVALGRRLDRGAGEVSVPG